MASGVEGAMQDAEQRFLEEMRRHAIGFSQFDLEGRGSEDRAKVTKCVINMDQALNLNSEPSLLGFNFEDHTTTDVLEIELDQVHEEYKGAMPNNVMIVGEPGAGKTTLAKQYVAMVSSGQVETLKHIKLATFVSAYKLFGDESSRDIKKDAFDVIFTKQVGFQMDPDARDAGIRFLSHQADQTLLVIDGLDRCSEPFGETYESIVNKILSGILRGFIWPGVKTVFTGRPHLFWKLPLLEKPDKLVALRGYDSLNLEKAISNMGERSRRQAILEHLKCTSHTLLPICCNPTLLKLFVQEFKNCDEERPPMSSSLVSLSSVMACRLRRLRKRFGYDAIRKLAALAYRGVVQRKFIFDDDLEEGYFEEIFVPCQSRVLQRRLFEFSDRTMQECLAAVHVLNLNDDDLEVAVSLRLNYPDMTLVRKLLYGYAVNSDTKTFIKLYLQKTETDEALETAEIDDLLSAVKKVLMYQLNEKLIAKQTLIGMELVSLLSECGAGGCQELRNSITRVEMHDCYTVPFYAHSLSFVIENCRNIKTGSSQWIEPLKLTSDVLLRCFKAPGNIKFKAKIAITKRVERVSLQHTKMLLTQLQIESLLLACPAQLKKRLLHYLSVQKITCDKLFIKGRIFEDSFGLIGKALSNNQSMEAVGFIGVNASDEHFRKIASELDPEKKLCNWLLLENCKSITPAAYAEFGKLAMTVGADSVILNGNDLDRVKLMGFCRVISETQIRQLVIKDGKMNMEAFRVLAPALRDSKSLVKLHFYDCYFNDGKIRRLEEIVRSTKLTTTDIFLSDGHVSKPRQIRRLGDRPGSQENVQGAHGRDSS